LEDGSDFDSAKAELFEAIGHPNRIRIIQALDQESMGFADLKKRVGMESSGHLAFHLGKLDHLVGMNTDGHYALTGEGKEALRMIQTVRGKGNGGPNVLSRITRRNSLTALLAVLVIVLVAIAAVQQVEIFNITSRPPGTTLVDGKSFWYTVIPLQLTTVDRNTSIVFDGVDFILFPSHILSFTISGSPSGAGGSVTIWSNGNPSSYGTVTFVVSGVTNPIVQVEVRFADGVKETTYLEHIVAANGTMNFVDVGSPPTWPWISSHVNPQVAISENSTTITLYVAAGR